MATVVTNAGRAIITNRIKGAGGAEPVNVGSGTGAGTATVTDTALFTEVTEARVAGASSQQQTTVANDTYQVIATQTYGGTKTITNAGNFDNTTGGNLLVHGDFTGIAVNSGDSIQFTIKCVMG